MTQYVNSNPGVSPTPVAQVPPVQAPPVVPPPQQQEILQQETEEAQVTPQAKQFHSGKARVEYRDQQGNVLDEALVASLAKEGKVSFETRHETRTRLEHAHEVDMINGQVAPPHPDVEGQNPETVKHGNVEVAGDSPASVAGGESSLEQPNSPEPKPASEANEATQQ